MSITQRGPGHELSCFLQLSTVGYNKFLKCLLAPAIPTGMPVRVPVRSYQTRVRLPCRTVLLSSPLLTLTPTAESTVSANLFVILFTPRSMEYLFGAVSTCAHSSPTLRFRFRREGGESEGGGVIASCRPFWVRYAAINSWHWGISSSAILEVRLVQVVMYAYSWNPTVVTNVNVVPALVVRTEVVAETPQCGSRGEVAVMRSRSEGPLQPSLRPT